MPEDIFEKIESYLNGEMTPDQVVDFENRIEASDDLKEQLRLYKETTSILFKKLNPSEGEQILKNLLQEKQKAYFDVDPEMKVAPKRKKWLWPGMVAAAVLILLFTWAPWQQDILSQFGQAEMINPTVRGNEDNQELTRASQLFNNKKYKEALPLLDHLVKESPTDASARFYRGVSLLHLKKADQAREDLSIIFEGESLYKYRAAYFIGLSYFQQRNKKAAAEWLDKIPEDASIYSQAQLLKKKIGK